MCLISLATSKPWVTSAPTLIDEVKHASPLVAGNWKMHGTRASVAELIKGLRQLALPAGIEVAVFPPCLYINQVAQGLDGKSIAIGAQNCAVEPMQGALTGEVAASQLADAGCTFVLVGHSERRLILGERDEVVSRKFAAAQSCGLVPVLCVGETQEQREAGKTLEVVGRQLGSVIEELGVGHSRKRWSHTSRSGLSVQGSRRPAAGTRGARCNTWSACGGKCRSGAWCEDSLRRQCQGGQCGRIVRHAGYRRGLVGGAS